MTAPARGRSAARGLAVATAWLGIGGLNVVALICALFLWAALLTGDYRTDRDMMENSGVWLTLMALAGTACALLSLLIDAGAVRLRWMPRWTLPVPAVLLAAVLLAYAATRAG